MSDQIRSVFPATFLPWRGKIDVETRGFNDQPGTIMTGFTTYILTMQVLTGLLLIAVSVPLILGKIGPNPWYGFRVRRTLEDPKVWYKANAYAGKALIGPAIAMIAFSTTFYLIPIFDPPTYATVCAVVTLGSIGIGAIACFRYLDRITNNSGV